MGWGSVPSADAESGREPPALTGCASTLDGRGTNAAEPPASSDRPGALVAAVAPRRSGLDLSGGGCSVSGSGCGRTDKNMSGGRSWNPVWDSGPLANIHRSRGVQRPGVDPRVGGISAVRPSHGRVAPHRQGPLRWYGMLGSWRRTPPWKGQVPAPDHRIREAFVAHKGIRAVRQGGGRSTQGAQRRSDRPHRLPASFGGPDLRSSGRKGRERQRRPIPQVPLGRPGRSCGVVVRVHRGDRQTQRTQPDAILSCNFAGGRSSAAAPRDSAFVPIRRGGRQTGTLHRIPQSRGVRHTSGRPAVALACECGGHRARPHRGNGGDIAGPRQRVAQALSRGKGSHRPPPDEGDRGIGPRAVPIGDATSVGRGWCGWSEAWRAPSDECGAARRGGRPAAKVLTGGGRKRSGLRQATRAFGNREIHALAQCGTFGIGG